MKVLITGATGFIGSRFAEICKGRGYDVVALGQENNDVERERKANLRRVGVAVEQLDLGSDAALGSQLSGVDVVFHLAAAVGVRLIVESPVNTIETNVHGTEMVLKLANKKRKKVLLTSTSEVYGKADAVPFREDGDLVMGPTSKGRWSYACSKAIDEFLGLAYHKEKRLPVVVARLFNTVGPRQTGRYGMVIPSFVKQALLGHPVTVYGDGTQTRCFTYVTDVVGQLVALAEDERAVGGVWNIGNDRDEVTILELARRVVARTGSRSPIELVPYDRAYEEGFEDMLRRVPDLSKLRGLTGYEPKVQLDEILDRVVSYFMSDATRL